MEKHFCDVCVVEMPEGFIEMIIPKERKPKEFCSFKCIERRFKHIEQYLESRRDINGKTFL